VLTHCLLKALIYSKNKKELFNTERKESALKLIRGEKCQTHFEFELNNQDPYFPAAK
jgi:hypothetical protein